MRNTTIREKLYDYIRFADDKKVKAIYTIVESEIAAMESPWEDPAFLVELDHRVTEFERGKVKGASWEEIKAKAKTLKV
jgi:hypothetical protein